MIDGFRGKRDGYTFIGCKKLSQNKEIINDFIIPSKDKETANRHRGKHLQIEYNIEQNNYQIKDLGVGYGAFVKLARPLELKDNHLLNMGESFIIVNLVQDPTIEKKNRRNSGYSISTDGSQDS